MLSDGLLGALIGGGATVIVSGITNYFVVRNLKKQQDHDARQKAEDRKAALRREVYLKVVEDIHALHAEMGNIQNRALDDSNAAAYLNLLQSTGKLWIVAEYETTVLSRKFVNVVSEAYLRAISLSMDVRSAVARVGRTRQTALDARTAVEAAKQVLDRADVEYAAGVDLNSLFGDLNVATAFASKAEREHDQAVEVSLPLRRTHSQLVFDELRRSNELFIQLVAALRNEIGLRSDVAAFRELIAEQEKRAATAFASAMDNISGKKD